jgi:ribosome maturation factor RimP
VSSSVADKVYDLLEPLAEGHGVELVATEVAGAKNSPVLRVFLDRDGGIDLDAITDANAWISDALDADPLVSGPYVLEVSSPGLERPLRTAEDFLRYCGERASVKTHAPIDGRRRFSGTLEGVGEGCLIMDCDGQEYEIPFDAIAKARLKPEIDFGSDRTDD